MVGLAQPRRRLDERIEHRLQIEGRATDDLEHVGGGGLLLQADFRRSSLSRRVFSMAMTACAAKLLDKLDLLVGERANLLAIDDNGANQLVILKHRNAEIGARSGELRWGNAQRIAVR